MHIIAVGFGSTHTPSLHAWVRTVSNLGADFLSDLDVGVCIFQGNVPIETFNISFESTQNKQQYGTRITCTDVKGKSYGD